MKRICFTLIVLACNTFAFAQDDYNKLMTDNISKLEVTRNIEDFADIANVFDQIGYENGTWQSYYFAAYAYIKKVKALLQENKPQEIDEAAEMAEKYATLAMLKNPKTAEVPLLFKMIHNLKMNVNLEERYAQESELGNKFMIEANKLDQNNPRLLLVKAEELYFNPTKFGGDEEKGIALLQKAVDQFKTFKPASNLDPNWGKAEAELLLKQAKK